MSEWIAIITQGFSKLALFPYFHYFGEKFGVKGISYFYPLKYQNLYPGKVY
jgi:hypothetical protein